MTCCVSKLATGLGNEEKSADADVAVPQREASTLDAKC